MIKRQNNKMKIKFWEYICRFMLFAVKLEKKNAKVVHIFG